MAAFNGKWKLIELGDKLAFCNAIHSPEEYVAQLKTNIEVIKADPSIYYEEIKVDKAAGTTQRVTYIGGEKKKDSGVIKAGLEIDSQSIDGRPAKVKVVIESDTKITTSEKGDGFSLESTAEVSGDTMTVTVVSDNGAKFPAIFKKM
jgi:hypothetical protein